MDSLKIRVCQIGARRHYAVPRAFDSLGALELLVTDACAELAPWRWFPNSTHESLPAPLRGLLGRRSGIECTRLLGLPGWTLAGWLRQSRDECPTDRWARRNEAFCRAALKQPWGNIDAVYGFNAASLELFESAKARGLRCILDQTAAPWRWNTQMLREEAVRWPGWETDGAEIDVNGALAAREEAEWSLADTIICGSRFAADMVDASLGRSRTCVVSYPQPALSGLRAASMLRRGPLRVLYVGSLQLRKGIQYLWQAKQMLGDSIDVRVVGPSLLSAHGIGQLRSCMDVRGARPRSEVLQHLEWADAFVLPSLSEGSANACHEAMAAGVPTITTRNSGSPTQQGENGWLIPVRDPCALAERLSAIDSIRLMRQRLQSERSVHIPRTVSDYGKDLLDVIGHDGKGMEADMAPLKRERLVGLGSPARR